MYRLLYQYADMEPYQNSLKWILKATERMADDKWESEIQSAVEFDKGYHQDTIKAIRVDVYSNFKRLLEEEALYRQTKVLIWPQVSVTVKYWTLLKNFVIWV